MSRSPRRGAVGRAGAVGGILVLVAAGLAMASPVAATPAQDGGEDRLEVSLLTFGQGARVWEKFGHNALMIRDTVSGASEVYNWGIFDFAQEDFFRRLLLGEMRYRLARSSRERTLRRYRSDRRSVRVQRLRLTPGQERELLRKARINLRPENRFYAYDPYRDNCSTRARDLLDEVLDGAIRARTAGLETGLTLRDHTRRLLGRTFWPYLGIMLGLGAGTDRPVDAWEEMFLPLRMEERVRDVRVPDGEGGTVPLVASEDTLYASSRPPAPREIPGRLPLLLGLGSVLGVGMAGLGLAGRRRRDTTAGRVARRLFGTVAGLWGLGVGVTGTILTLSWLLTDHWYMHGNENLLQANPVSLLLALAVPLSLWTGRMDRVARGLAWTVAGLAGVGALAQVLPTLDQVNGSVIAVMLPVHLGVAAGLRALRPPETPGGNAPPDD